MNEEYEAYFTDRLKELSVLLVEDEATSRLLMDSMLSKIFKTVYSANNGVEALGILKSQKIHLVVTDINMPEMNGLELAEAIRNDYPKIHIVMMSSDSDSDVLLESVNLGIDAYILKPVSQESVTKTIHRVGKYLVSEVLQEEYARNLSSLNTDYLNKIKELEEANARYAKMLQRFDLRIKQEYKQSVKHEKPQETTQKLEKIDKEHLDELAEIEEEVDCFANMFILKKVSSENLDKVIDIGYKLQKYQSILKKYPYHLVLSDNIEALARTLRESYESIDSDNLASSGPYFDSLFFMLKRFREEILNKLPDARNPNIFDASMIADIKQIIMLLTNEQESSDIEFF